MTGRGGCAALRFRGRICRYILNFPQLGIGDKHGVGIEQRYCQASHSVSPLALAKIRGKERTKRGKDKMPGFHLLVLPGPFFGGCRRCGIKCGKAFSECHGNATGRGLSAQDEAQIV